MNLKEQTHNTYKTSAEQMALRYNKIGARIEDIEEVFSLIKKVNPSIIEIGCGNGRDAEIILKHTNDYLGIDISDKFISMAQEKNPLGKFQLTDIEEFKFQNNRDIIFAFASLVHTPKEILHNIFNKIYESLSENGLFRLSLKYNNSYQEHTNEDEFGTRTYYHYSQREIDEIQGNFKTIKNEVVYSVGQEWIEIIFQK